MDMNEVISLKCRRKTIAWPKAMYLGHEVQDLLSVKTHTSSKILKFCQHFRGTETYMGKSLRILIFDIYKGKVI